MPDLRFWFTGSALYLSGSFFFAIAVGLIGVKEMVSRNLFYVLMAVALILSAMAWYTAAKQESAAAEQAAANTTIQGLLTSQSGNLRGVMGQNTKLLDAISKIAGAAQVNTNQSTQVIADSIIDKLTDFQKQLNKNNSDIESLQNPPRDDQSLYQNNKVVANFHSGIYTKSTKSMIFTLISNVKGIDFEHPIEFRSLVLQCEPHSLDDLILGTPDGMLSNVMKGVICRITSGELDVSKYPPTAPQSVPAPPPPPTGK